MVFVGKVKGTAGAVDRNEKVITNEFEIIIFCRRLSRYVSVCFVEYLHFQLCRK